MIDIDDIMAAAGGGGAGRSLDFAEKSAPDAVLS